MHGLAHFTKRLRAEMPAQRRRRDLLSKQDLLEARTLFNMHMCEHLTQ
jgi:hypothetical protein